MSAIFKITPIRDSDNSYPKSIEWEVSDSGESITVIISNRKLQFSADKISEVVLLAERRKDR